MEDNYIYLDELNEQSAPSGASIVYAPQGGKPGYRVKKSDGTLGQWIPVDKSALDSPGLKATQLRYEQERLKRDEEEARKQAERLGDAPARETGVPRGQTPPKSEPAPAKPVPSPDKRPAPSAAAVKPAPAAAPKPTDRYRELIAQDKRKEAEAVGKEIWAKKYAGKFTVPSVEKSGPRIDVATSRQQDLFKAAEKGVNLPRVRSIKDDIKDLRKIRPMPEAYDVVLDYLLSEGHADTVEEAHYVMMQMDAEYIQSIVEKFPDVKGTLNPWESPTTGKSGVKYVTDPKTGKPVQIRNPLYKGV